MAVGQNVLRKEGYEKLTGSARYIDDITIPGMLYGKTIRSRIARGRIKSISFDSGFDWSNIVVADYRDIPGKNYVALIEDDQLLLAESEVRHYDEPILLIAAATKALAEQAARRITIDSEPLDPVLTIEDALQASEVIYGADNVFKRFLISRGDTDEGFSQADAIVEGEYRLPHQEQLYIEPQGMIAIPASAYGGLRKPGSSDPYSGELTVLGSMQCPYYVHKSVK